MNNFDENLAREVIEKTVINNDDERFLINSFIEICRFLGENPNRLSWRTSKTNPNKPSIVEQGGLFKLANKHVEGYRRSDLPTTPSTVPDEMVSVIMGEFYEYSEEDCQRIQIEHQYSMGAENCVGNLLERYIDSVLRYHNWYWCCGNFVKAIDFLSKNEQGEWFALQIKNRDNSENSSSSAIRDGTHIKKWFRSFSQDTKKGRESWTNWSKLPLPMHNYSLGEEGFKEFVVQYIHNHKPKHN